MKKTILLAALMLTLGLGAASAQGGCCATDTVKSCCRQQNAALAAIMTRSSVRQFTDQPVEGAKVEQLLRAAMAAPTAMNRQPWHFVVVDDKSVLDQLGGPGRRGDMTRKAALAIAVCGDMTKAPEGEARDFWIQDVSAATENLLLAAHALGLGAVWTGVVPIQQRVASVSQVLGLPETVVPLSVVLVGYPAEQPQPKDKWQPANVSYNRYGGQR